MAVFESYNHLSLKMQGNKIANIMCYLCYYQSIYGMQTEMSNYLSFPTSSSLTENDDHWQENVKNPIGLHLDCLADKFICYFPENGSGNTLHKLVCNLFSVDVDSLPGVLQEEALNEKQKSNRAGG